ncbi:MAG: hypothetical protein ALECFALPRED_004408 [Alectoria fallacina]|uniref:Uncharacterized protein n=1 Tax=Alectoria fallacina TaxID=1903189 RepID=A0A8H3FT92_9LECA|nr:MAG: hypothetical protein ALECFALPRED_004408 [Alectoria fallacina]
MLFPFLELVAHPNHGATPPSRRVSRAQTPTNASLPLVAPNTTASRLLLLLLQNYGTDDATTSGKYQILLCGAGQANSKATKLQALPPPFSLAESPKGQSRTQKKGTASHHGFTAFFKSDANRAAVTTVFQKMAAGDPVPVSADRAMRLGSLTACPSFACLEQGDSFTAHLYAECLARNTATRYAPLLTWGATELIMICPLFLDPAGRSHGGELPDDCGQRSEAERRGADPEHVRHRGETCWRKCICAGVAGLWQQCGRRGDLTCRMRLS